MPHGEGFEKGSLNPFIIYAESEDTVTLKPKEESKAKGTKQKEEENKLIEQMISAKPFTPNFLWPIPNIEDESISHDGIWLIPSIAPEPYWDFSIGCDYYKVW